MLTALAFGLVCQHLELAREVIEPEEAVEVRAVDPVGEPISGLPVEVVAPDGSTRSLGTTNPGGIVLLVATESGLHELRAALPDGGPLLITPFRVASRPGRWLYAVVSVPLGLLLLFQHARRLRRRPTAPDGGATPGPSPPAP